MRAVIDTNLWISALLNPSGRPSRILDAFRDGRFVSVTSDALLEELEDVLFRPRMVKYGITSAESTLLLRFLRENSLLVPVEGTVRVCRDPEDDVLIETAMRGHAILVSGDKDLLDAPEVGGFLMSHRIPVWNAITFLAELEYGSTE